MSFVGSGSTGGGGGFGGFPYRSSHQQGTDGRQPKRRRRNYNRRKQLPLIYGADISVPPDLRPRLIGKGGQTISKIKTDIGCSIHVPPKKKASSQDDDNVDERPDTRPVYVKAPSVGSLLHACWKIAGICQDPGSNKDSINTFPCKIRIPGGSMIWQSTLAYEQSPFLTAPQQGIAAYCHRTLLDDEEINTLVDNERFADSSLTAHYEIVDDISGDEGDSTEDSCFVFIYGSASDSPDKLHERLRAIAMT